MSGGWYLYDWRENADAETEGEDTSRIDSAGEQTTGQSGRS